LDHGAHQYPVRVRNISSRGALIDGPTLPGPGARIRLSRGSLTVNGELAWRDEHYGGINFDNDIDVERWAQRVGHKGQQRIDVVISALRRSEPVPENLKSAAPTSLSQISAELDEVCERLANLPGLSATVGEELVRLDSVAQRLRELVQSSKARE